MVKMAAIDEREVNSQVSSVRDTIDESSIISSLLCAFGWIDDDGTPHPCDKPAPYIWGGQDKLHVASLCKQHLVEQYEQRRVI